MIRTETVSGEREMPENKILICHYRIGRTDGVSLEIEKRRRVLERMGYDVVTVGGPVSEKTDYVVEGLEFDAPVPRRIRKNAFFELADYPDGETLIREMTAFADTLTNDLMPIVDREKPSGLMLHNIFSHGRHIAAARAFAQVADEIRIPIQAMCHDWWWERPEYADPKTPLISDWLSTYLPYRGANMRYAVINSIAQGALEDRTDIRSEVIPDTLDFEQEPWLHDDFNAHLRKDLGLNENDLLLLQATRIVERKGIETAVDFAGCLAEPPAVDKLRGAEIYNGRRLADNPRVVLLLAGYAEKDSESYREALREKAERNGVEVLFAADHFGSHRTESPRRYSLWDAYVAADAVTYPSIHEGWGNQFIEAVFAGKPIALFEYPVFRRDIGPVGYRYISFGSHYNPAPEGNGIQVPRSAIESAAAEMVEWLTGNHTTARLEENRALGARNHSLTRLEECLRQNLDF